MPYSGASDPDIPDTVPEDDKAQWVKVWNSTYSSCIDDGGSESSCETQAFKAANGAIKNEERSADMQRGFFGALDDFVTGIKKVFDTFQERAVSVSSVGNEVFEQFYSQGMWLNDLYVEDGEMFAVASEGGKLFRAAVDIDDNGDIQIGDLQEVIAQFEPVSRATFRKTDDGKVRMLAASASSVLNKNGEIDAKSLFDSMADFMERTGKTVPRTFFHLGEEFKTGDIVHMVRDDNVLITVTEFDDSELANREIKAREKNPEYWGDSIEYDPVGDPELQDVGDGITIPVYRAGIPLAVSTLPAELAGSYYADKFTIKRQEVKHMTLQAEKREALIEVFDGDEAAVDEWLEENVSPINRKIADTGQISREETESEADDESVEEEPPEEESTEESEEESSEESEEESESESEEESTEESTEEQEVIVEFDDEMAREVADTVIGSTSFVEFKDGILEAVEGLKTGLSDLTTTVGELQALSVQRTKEIAELKKDEDEKKEEWQEDLPRRQQARVTFRPRKDASEEAPEERSMQETADATLANIKT